MSSYDAYEQNLQVRLKELQQGDKAYETHTAAILETLPYEAAGAPLGQDHRILDVGCGLGFLACKLAQFSDCKVVGIDPSQMAIELATEEHAGQQNLSFFANCAQDLPDLMKDNDIAPFERAILNMVLHSVDDEACSSILQGVRDALVNPGILTLIVPGRNWLIQKLIAKAQNDDMKKQEGIDWVAKELEKEAVTIEVGIQGQRTYPAPLTVYNRTLKDYAALLLKNGFGLNIGVCDPITFETTETITSAFWEWNDHSNGYELSTSDRHILMTQTM